MSFNYFILCFISFLFIADISVGGNSALEIYASLGVKGEDPLTNFMQSTNMVRLLMID